jgi:hypothetical protein
MKAKNGTNVVTVSMREASLKKVFRRHLRSLGFQRAADGTLLPPGTGKEVVRGIHSAQRNERLTASQKFVADRLPSLLKYFASGCDVVPASITPKLQLVKSDTWEGDLFRLASLTWSVPVSNGFGRRLRFLVWDDYNGRLIGIIAIGDPVFNLSARDNLIGWDVKARGERLVNMMDAYVLGAVPPYNALLGGKLVACMVRSRDVYDQFAKAYGKTTGIISQQQKKARLLAVTTSSSLGRSSVYSRLKVGGIEYFTPIGYTGGWGHFHIPDSLFADLRDYLREIGHSYADLHCYGEGPNWRMRSTRAALEALGFKDDILRHGIQREVFLCQFADNAAKLLRTGKGKPDLSSLLSAEDVAKLAVERWILPRSERRPEFKLWKREGIETLIGEPGAALMPAQRKRV